jgi:hypothetical protein
LFIDDCLLESIAPLIRIRKMVLVLFRW